MLKLVLALDCGTTGNRAVVFDRATRCVVSAYREFTQHYPRPGWVEHDAEEIWRSVRAVIARVFDRVSPSKIGALGIANQRETVVVWERATGRPAARAIVWQCRRTGELCAGLKKRGLEGPIHRRTGLFLDPYFSASKILWLSQNRPAIRKGLRDGTLLCGTIDAWIIWKLSGGASFSTDPTNASRTMLFNIRSGRWDPWLLRIFKVPRRSLPEVLPSVGVRAVASKKAVGAEIPIAGVAGDQQSASFAQGCFRRGVVKNTYGTGLFVVAETGYTPKYSNRLITTAAVTTDKRPRYALEGSIFIGGAALQWLRDGLGIIRSAGDSERIARKLRSNEDVYFVPALAGLGCPHWDAGARGVIVGLTRGTDRRHFVRAALESMAYQTRDVTELFEREAGIPVRRLNVDGGAAKNDFLMQFQADVLGRRVERPVVTETTALGAAGLAGIACGLWKTKEDFLKSRKVDRIFEPTLPAKTREKYYARWRKALEKAKGWI